MIGRAPFWTAPAFALAACVNVPVSDQLIVSSAERTLGTEDGACSQGWRLFTASLAGSRALDPAGFTLMTWNVLKERKGRWSEDYARLSRDRDIVLLQEAHLTRPLRDLLEQFGYSWYMTRAFDYQGAATGVLTAGKSPASGACLSRLREPLIRVPKSALLTRFPLEGSSDELLVANLHGINFTLGTTRYRAQLEALERAMAGHTGPIVLAGDFNDWSQRRNDIVSLVGQRLELVPVQLEGDERGRHWGRPVDHVLYRGLEVVQAQAIKVTSSDHNPLLVRFRLPRHQLERTR